MAPNARETHDQLFVVVSMHAPGGAWQLLGKDFIQFWIDPVFGNRTVDQNLQRGTQIWL